VCASAGVIALSAYELGADGVGFRAHSEVFRRCASAGVSIGCWRDTANGPQIRKITVTGLFVCVCMCVAAYLACLGARLWRPQHHCSHMGDSSHTNAFRSRIDHRRTRREDSRVQLLVFADDSAHEAPNRSSLRTVIPATPSNRMPGRYIASACLGLALISVYVQSVIRCQGWIPASAKRLVSISGHCIAHELSGCGSKPRTTPREHLYIKRLL